MNEAVTGNPGAPAEWWRPEIATADRQRAVAAAPALHDSPLAFWALMAFTFILFIAPQNIFPALAPLRPALFAAAVAITAYVFGRFIHRQPITVFTREMRLAAYLLGWAILSVPLSYWPGGSISFLFDVYLKSLAIFWLLSNTVTSVSRLRQVAWGLTLMSIPVAIVGVENFLSGSFLQEGAGKRIVGYNAPLTANPNDLALTLNLILPLSVALFLICRRPMVRPVLLAIVFLEVIAIILTFSRGGFLTLVTTSVLYLWKFRGQPEGRWIGMAVGFMLMCLLFVVSGYMDRLATITDMESDLTGSAQQRWDDTVAGVGFVLQYPIVGAGVGMNVLALNEERGAVWKAIHNAYLEYAVELGIPGSLLFLLLMITCIRSATSVLQGSASAGALRELFYLAHGIHASLVAFAVAALFHPVAYHFYFYYMAGLAVAVKGVYEREKGLSIKQD